MAKKRSTEGLAIHERAVLVDLDLSIWPARKLSRALASELSELKEAETASVGVSKRIVPPRELAKVSNAGSRLRHSHKLLTLPWDDSGKRIITTLGLDHYSSQTQLGVRVFQGAVKEWLKVYRENERHHFRPYRTFVGKMFDPDDYPTHEEVRDYFKAETHVESVPRGEDFRAQISEADARAVAADIERRTSDRINGAMNQLWRRLAEMTETMVNKLREYEPPPLAKNVFKQPLIDRMREIAEMIPALNITGDKRLDQLQQRILKELCARDAEDLRTNEAVRERTADRGEEIFNEISAYL